MKNLTGKTFLLLLALSMTVSIFAYGCIWLFLPYADKDRAQRVLEERTRQLAEKLWESKKAESERLFTEFIQETGAYAVLVDINGRYISPYTFQEIVPADSGETLKAEGEIRLPVQFSDGDFGEEYLLTVRYHASRAEGITAAVYKSMPYAACFLLVVSFACALIFSRYTTAPIVRINKIAGKMAQLDFSWYCPDVRDDEIGMLSKNINELSDKLHAALDELYLRNAALEDEIALEKERERRQMLFFSGVSHELKTPLAIVIGQLEGMQAGIGVYKDKEKYLARSIEILQSLNQFVKEILLISHMDITGRKESRPVCLSKLVRELADEYDGYADFYSAAFEKEIQEELYVYGEPQMLKKALGNVIGNAITHSGTDGRVVMRLRHMDDQTVFTVVNTPAHIAQEHLPHVFEAFYRGDAPAGNGSGLGLYITGMILDTYGAFYGKSHGDLNEKSYRGPCGISYGIENTDTGVVFTVIFR